MTPSWLEQLHTYTDILETHFQDMVDIEFVVEHNRIYLLSARVGRRTPIANLRIVMSLFCEGKLTVEELLERIPYKHLESLLSTKIITNTEELKTVAEGISANSGVETAYACFSRQAAETVIEKGDNFIFCCSELSPNDFEILSSSYCKGVVSGRGGLTSHAAVACRGIGLPCVSGIGDIVALHNRIPQLGCEITIDGDNGKIYTGIPNYKKQHIGMPEIQMLTRLLKLIVQYNMVTSEKTTLLWRLWNVVVLKRRYIQMQSKKHMVEKGQNKYISFTQPDRYELHNIFLDLEQIANSNILVEDLIDFLQTQLSAHVSVGNHYRYMRPLCDPMKVMHKTDAFLSSAQSSSAGIQLTGVEFFNINKYIDFLIDIYSIKIFFSTPFFTDASGMSDGYNPLNYLDYTNPNGEGIIINTYNCDKIAIYINDTKIQSQDIPKVYHFLRRRQYHWSWFQENNTSKSEIINYLQSKSFVQEAKPSKLYYLCVEKGLLCNCELTQLGKSLIGDENMEKEMNLEYILDEVIARGYDVHNDECNDYSLLIKRKDFKELVALEIYEVYFWQDRHEFDLELCRVIIDAVYNYFCDPNILQQIEAGLLQTLPSTLIIAMVGKIISKLKKHDNKESPSHQQSAWTRIKDNADKIEREFSNHEYVLTNDIEHIFNASREEILPLLKLSGCTCYTDKKRSIWIKAGISEARIKQILKEHKFKSRK